MFVSHSSLESAKPGQWIESYYDICGTAPLEDAEVVFVTDYNNAEIATRNVQLINQIWQKQLLLVEEAPAEEVVQAERHPMSLGISKHIPIQGWDHPLFKTRLDVLAKRQRIITELAARVHSQLLTSSWGCFLRDDEAFASLMSYRFPLTRENVVCIRNLLMQGQYEAFIRRVRVEMADIQREQNALHFQLTVELWQPRIAFLLTSIKRGITLHKRVIVLLSGSFVIHNPILQGEKLSLNKMEQFAKSAKIAIINAKHAPLTFPNQPQLWLKRLPHALATVHPKLLSLKPIKAAVRICMLDLIEKSSERKEKGDDPA